MKKIETTPGIYHIQYRFKPRGLPWETFDVKIDKKTIETVVERPSSPPNWTKLDYYQCPQCPLLKGQNKFCPLALRLVPIVSRCNHILSYDKIRVEIRSPERTIIQNTTAQRGLRSLMGLVMATSGCPHTAFFKPMARFHLPFANDEETVYRASSMYLLAQYFVKQAGGATDFKLSGLTEVYKNLHTVNTTIALRLRSASRTDSTLNALVLLDIFTKIMPHAIEDSLQEIRHLFSPYFTSTTE